MRNWSRCDYGRMRFHSPRHRITFKSSRRLSLQNTRNVITLSVEAKLQRESCCGGGAEQITGTLHSALESSADRDREVCNAGFHLRASRERFKMDELMTRLLLIGSPIRQTSVAKLSIDLDTHLGPDEAQGNYGRSPRGGRPGTALLSWWTS